MLDTFTEVYDKSAAVLQSGSLHASWYDIDLGLRALLGAAAPRLAGAEVLDQLRHRLRQVSAGKPCSRTAAADEMLRAARGEEPGFQDRAALLKLMRHLYVVPREGAAAVWVLDAPRAYRRWSYDAFESMRASEGEADLKQDDEVFGPANRSMMAEALQLADRWSADVQMKLQQPAILDEIRRWFHLPDTAPAEVEETRAVLMAGFQEIQRACSTRCIVFSDQPRERQGERGRDGWAAVTFEDRVPVIYVFPVFLECCQRHATGHAPKLWQCAVTLIHVLSHKLLGTVDVLQEHDGLKPARFANRSGMPLHNAESWAYFAAAVGNALQPATVNRVLR